MTTMARPSLPETGPQRPGGWSALALWLTVALIALFTVCITVARMISPEDADLRLLLTRPDNCPMPCWFGIRPGVTTPTEALALLSTHPWGGQADADQYNAVTGSGIIGWEFEPNRLSIIPRYRGVRLRANNHVIINVTLPPGIPFDAVWFAFGPPPEIRRTLVALLNTSSFRLDQAMFYSGEGLTVTNRIRCPMRAEDVWSARSIVQLGTPLFAPLLDPIADTARAEGDGVNRLLRKPGRC